jgi:hypothetical protein
MGASSNPVLLASVLIAESRKGFVPRSGIPVAIKRLKHRFDPKTPASIVRRWGRIAFEVETLYHHMTSCDKPGEAVKQALIPGCPN